jgi:hypothetical protein
MLDRGSSDDKAGREWMPLAIERELENSIRSAKSYIIPSEHLRPKTLLAARERWEDKLSTRTFYRYTLAIAVVFALIMYAAQGLSILSLSIEPTASEEISESALRMASENKIEIDWAVQHVYSQHQQQRASQYQGSLFDSNSTERNSANFSR